ncbi:MAG: dTDP-4-dehydrorhamnose 3,5-epimerase [Nitrospirota bacterium]|jgi:dTDP-4-dehydrorhamnose 3,5-epimerase
MPFTFIPLEIPGLMLIEPKVFGDERGFFMEAFKLSEFRAKSIEGDFVQDNLSRSKKGVLRGLHYQLNPKAQGKLITTIKGAVFDVAVDIRKGSPYYGKWVARELSEENRLMFWIPPGFAHGFLTLSDSAEIIYKTTEEYAPEFERGIIWNDPGIGIKWPLESLILSDRDKALPTIDEAEINFPYGGQA